MDLAAIERRLAELRESHVPDAPFDWDDVEYLRLLADKLSLGVAQGFNADWFQAMAQKVRQTLQRHDGIAAVARETITTLELIRAAIAGEDGCDIATECNVAIWNLREALGEDLEEPNA